LVETVAGKVRAAGLLLDFLSVQAAVAGPTFTLI